MAYGGFTGYQEHPTTGLTSFQRADAPPITAFGPAASDLKAKIDAANQFAPVAVAANGAATSATGLPADYEAESADRVASALDAPAQPVTQSEPNMSIAPPNASPAGPAQTQPSPAPAAVSAPTPEAPKGVATPLLFDPKTRQTIYLRPGGDRNNPADLFTMAQPTAATPGGYQPSSMKVSGANTAATPGDLDTLRENSIDQKLAYQTAYDIHAQNFAEQRAALDAQADANRIAMQEAQNRMQQVQAKSDALQLQYEQAKKEYSSSKVNPNRYMSGAAGVASAIAMGLGAYGASITKSPNFAANFVNQQIQSDIAAQEAAIRIKGAAAQTALGDLQRGLGSLDLAKTAYTGAVLQEQKRRLETLANTTASRDAAANYLQGAAQLDAALQANDLAFRQQAAGHVETELKYRAPTAGSAGGPRPVTGSQFSDASHGAPKLHASQKSQEQRYAVEDSKAALIELGAAVGLRWDPEKQEMVGDTKTIAGNDQFGTEARIKAKAILEANAGTIADAAGEKKPPVGQIDDWVNAKIPHGVDTGEKLKQYISGAYRNVERKGQHAAVQTAEPDAEPREEREE